MIGTTIALLLSQTTAVPNWIWAPGAAIPPRVLFRRDLDLPAKPERAELTITCDDAYRLYVNGRQVASHASWYTMQDVDLGPYLHAGCNVLAVDGRNLRSVAGLLVIGHVMAGGQEIDLATGSEWKYSLTESQGWREPGFDDSAWPASHPIGPLGIAPWNRPADEGQMLRSMLSLGPADPLMRFPPTPDSVDLARRYWWPASMTGPNGRFQQMRVRPTVSVDRTLTKPASFIVDFGRELAGWVEVVAEGAEKPDLEIGTGESNDRFEATDTAVRQENGRWVFRTLHQGGFTGLRYARIDLKSVGGPVRIRSVSAIWRIWPANYGGSFSCSDPVLNRIWEMGAYTVRLNLDPKALGAILLPDRGDRYPWMGDDRVAHHTLFDCFGDYWLAKADLDFFVKPGQKPIDVNGIPGYTLDWVIGLYDYWMYSGDAAEVLKHLGDLSTILNQYGTTATPNGWMFTDWEPELQATTDKSVTAFHVKYLQAAQLASAMAEALGRHDLARGFLDLARKRLDFLRQRPDWPNGLPQHALTDALLAGRADRFPADVSATTTTPYFTYFVLEALSKAGQDERAIESLRSYWKGMLDLGATTTWEYFLPEWVKTVKPNSQPPDINGAILSLCHPWSAGASAWLSDHVLGVVPTSPGFATCQVRPFFGKLSWASGEVPTPHGGVRVSWRQRPTGPVVTVAVPRGVQASLVLPGGFRYSVNGRAMPDRNTFVLAGGATYRVAARRAN